MTIKIYADGADINGILELNKNPAISGFTTNPSLLKKAGVKNYEKFIKDVLSEVKEKPISFEVLSDTWGEMEREAKIISSFGDNVYVKIPIMTTEKIKTTGLVESLLDKGIKINLTCVFDYEQVEYATKILGNHQSIISIFAGRIMDAGYDATSIIRYAKYIKQPKQEILWASTRESWNIIQAEQCGADIITVTHDILKKLSMKGKDLKELSWETVCMFYHDAKESGFTL